MSLDYNSLIKSNDIVMVLFGASNCGPCKVLKYKLEDINKDNSRISYYYLDIVENQSLVAQNNIYAAPSLIVYCEGKETIRESGCFSLDLIMDKVDKYLALLD